MTLWLIVAAVAIGFVLLATQGGPVANGGRVYKKKTTLSSKLTYLFHKEVPLDESLVEMNNRMARQRILPFKIAAFVLLVVLLALVPVIVAPEGPIDWVVKWWKPLLSLTGAVVSALAGTFLGDKRADDAWTVGGLIIGGVLLIVAIYTY